MLLTGFGLLRLFRRNDPKKEMRETIARWANDQPQDWGTPDD